MQCTTIVKMDRLEDHDLNSETENSSSKRRRHSLDFKLKVVSESRYGNFSDIARKYSIDRSLIRSWKKNEKKLSGILNSKTKQFTSEINATHNSVTKFRISGGGQKALDQGMENLLFEWIKLRRLYGFRISRSIIQKKAKELSKIEDFKASDGWCTNFMHRFGIAYRTKTQQLEVC